MDENRNLNGLQSKVWGNYIAVMILYIKPWHFILDVRAGGYYRVILSYTRNSGWEQYPLGINANSAHDVTSSILPIHRCVQAQERTIVYENIDTPAAEKKP